MSTPSNETEKRESGTSMRPTSGPRRYKKLLIIAGILVAICALGLGLGVGLGLGLRAKSSVSNSSTLTTSDGSSSTSTLSGSVPAHTGSSWQPAVNDSFNYQLSVVPISSNPYGISIWFIDLFAATKDVIKGLQDNGAKVVCYFSAGSSENWRSDFQQFQASDLGNNLRGWEGERWLNTNSNTVRAIMKARMDQAVAKGCDGIDPDNMDACKSAQSSQHHHTTKTAE